MDGALTRRLAACLVAAVLLAGCGGRPPLTEPAPQRGEGSVATSPSPPPGGEGRGEGEKGENASSAGEIVAEPATLRSLAVRWPVRGDANVNAVVNVAYRVPGAPAWRAAYPLFRPRPAHQSPELRVPGGTKHGTVQRLRGEGPPVLGKGSQRGDIHYRFVIDVPSRLSDEQKAAIETLSKSINGNPRERLMRDAKAAMGGRV